MDYASWYACCYHFDRSSMGAGLVQHLSSENLRHEVSGRAAQPRPSVHVRQDPAPTAAGAAENVPLIFQFLDRRGILMQNILATGWLKQKGYAVPDEVLKYTIIRLSEEHLPVVMALQECIIQNLERPDLLQPFSCDFMRQHMGGQGMVLGVFVKDRLVAFRNLYFPDPDDAEWNLGRDLALPEEALAEVANLQMVCVHPRFRGNGLALRMNQISLGLLRERGTHPHVCATVSPYNCWNLPILLNTGFRVAMLKNKYRGKLRYILHQDLRRPFTFNDECVVTARLEDFDTQKRLFAAGFCGVALLRPESTGRDNHAGTLGMVFKLPADAKVVPLALNRPSVIRRAQMGMPADPGQAFAPGRSSTQPARTTPL
jgi:hypothetical protein